MDSYSHIERAIYALRSDPAVGNSSTCLGQLSWILLLKFIDELYSVSSDAETDADVHSIPLIYQWRTWAKIPLSRHIETGNNDDQLLQFVQGKLFPYMRTLTHNRADGTLLANVGFVFNHLENRISSVQTLIDVLRSVNEIKCTDIAGYGDIFERLTHELSNSGSGYVQMPASLASALVAVSAPKSNETIYDPAASTGRLLVEAAKYIRRAERRWDLTNSIGIGFFATETSNEALAINAMNAIFHRIQPVYLRLGDALSVDENFLVEGDQFDLILSNSPFGGKVKLDFAKRFGVKTDSQELLFLQKCMASLRAGGRAAVIVPEGVLTQQSAAAIAVKKQLLGSFNLHTILSLPTGTFLPFTAVKASVLFFDNTYPTEETWLYECRTDQPLSKHRGLCEEHLKDFIASFRLRNNSETAIKVPVSDLELNFDFAVKNYLPRYKAKSDAVDFVVSSLRKNVEESMAIMRQISSEIEGGELHGLPWHTNKVLLRDLCISMKQGFSGKAAIEGDAKFVRITDVKNGSVDWRGAQFVTVDESNHESFSLKQGEIIFARVGATAGKSALIHEVPARAVFASNLIKLDVHREMIAPEYLYLYFQSRDFLQKVDKNLSGAVQLSISSSKLGGIDIPLPPIDEQMRLVRRFGELYVSAFKLTELAELSCRSLQSFRTSLLEDLFGDSEASY